jgi:hypothetical protein
MRSRTRLILSLVLVAAGCRLESRPPPGLPADEAAIRSAVAAWLAREAPWARIVRSDVRQDKDLATAWVIASPPSGDGDGERAELFVLRRDAAGWSVAFHGIPARAREPSRAAP